MKVDGGPGDWAELLRRVFGGDGFRCPHCAGLLRLRPVVVGPPATTTILRDLARGTASTAAATSKTSTAASNRTRRCPRR